MVVDQPSNLHPTVAAKLPFFEGKDAKFGEVLRVVSFTPGTNLASFKNLIP